jgi:hypothetical protein
MERYSKELYACIPIAALVIIGNSLASPHVKLMMTFSKPLNAILLIVVATYIIIKSTSFWI